MTIGTHSDPWHILPCRGGGDIIEIPKKRDCWFKVRGRILNAAKSIVTSVDKGSSEPINGDNTRCVTEVSNERQSTSKTAEN